MKRLRRALTSETALGVTVVLFAMVVGVAIWTNLRGVDQAKRIGQLEHPTERRQLQRIYGALKLCLADRECRHDLAHLVDRARREERQAKRRRRRSSGTASPAPRGGRSPARAVAPGLEAAPRAAAGRTPETPSEQRDPGSSSSPRPSSPAPSRPPPAPPSQRPPSPASPLEPVCQLAPVAVPIACP